MVVLLVTFVVLVAAMVIYLAHHLMANDVRNDPVVQPSEKFQPIVSSTLRLSREDWQGLCKVWQSICERYPVEPKTALAYADMVMSDLLRDRAGSPESATMVIRMNDAETQQCRAAHEIVVRGRARMLDPKEFDRAMDLYKDLFDEIFAASELPRRLSRGS